MTIEEQKEYVRRINLVINRDKTSFLMNYSGWQVILEKFEILFSSNMVKVNFRLIKGRPLSERYDNVCRANVIKDLLELFKEHYYYIIPKGYVLIFEGSGINYTFHTLAGMQREIDKYLDIILS